VSTLTPAPGLTVLGQPEAVLPVLPDGVHGDAWGHLADRHRRTAHHQQSHDAPAPPVGGVGESGHGKRSTARCRRVVVHDAIPLEGLVLLLT
jgi:hypothetical protein